MMALNFDHNLLTETGRVRQSNTNTMFQKPSEREQQDGSY